MGRWIVGFAALAVGCTAPEGPGPEVAGTLGAPVSLSEILFQFNVSGDSQSVAWDDVTGDGHLELAVGTGAGPVAGGDLDGDGDEDIAVGVLGGDDFVLRNDTSPFAAPTALAGVTDHSYAVAWGDLDADGDLDLATVDAIGGPTRVFRNDGNGSFALVWSSSQTFDAYDVAIGDLNGDGNLDLAVAANGAANVV